MKRIFLWILVFTLLLTNINFTLFETEAEAKTEKDVLISSDFLNGLSWTADEGSTSKTLLDQMITGTGNDAVYSGTDLLSSVLGEGWGRNYNLASSVNYYYAGPAKLEKDGNDTVLTVTRDTNRQTAQNGNANKWTPRSGISYSLDEAISTTSKNNTKLIFSTDAKVINQNIGIGVYQTWNNYVAAYVGFSPSGIIVGKNKAEMDKYNDSYLALSSADWTIGSWYNLKLIVNADNDTYDAVISYEAEALPNTRYDDFNYVLENGRVTVSTKTSIPLNNDARATSRSVSGVVLGYGQQIYSTSFKNISLEKITYAQTSLEKVTDAKGAELANGGSVWTLDGTDINLKFNAEMPASPADGGITVKDSSNTDVSFTTVLSADKKSYKLQFASALSAGSYTVSVTDALKDSSGDSVAAASRTFSVSNTKKYDFQAMTSGTTASDIETNTGVTLHQGGGLEFSIGYPNNEKTKVNSLVMGLNGETNDTPYVEIPVPATENDFEIKFSYGSWTVCYPYTELYSGDSKNLKVGHASFNRAFSYYTDINETESEPQMLITLPSAGAYNLGFANVFPTYTLRVNQSTATYDIIVANDNFKNYASFLEGIRSHNNNIEIGTAAGTMTLRSIPLEGTVTGNKKIRLGLQYVAAANANKMGITNISVTDLGKREEDFAIDSVKYTDYAKAGTVKTELTGGESLKAVFNTVNNTDDEKSLTALLAVYGDDNKLKKVYTRSVDMAPKSAKVNSIFVKTGDDFDVIEAGDYARLFIWDKLDSLKPLDIVEDGERTVINSVTLSSLEAKEINTAAWTLGEEQTEELLSKKA